MLHEKVLEANVFTNKMGVTDVDLGNKIRLTVKQNQNAVKQFLLSNETEIHLEFQQKRNTRKRSRNVSTYCFTLTTMLIS